MKKIIYGFILLTASLAVASCGENKETNETTSTVQEETTMSKADAEQSMQSIVDAYQTAYNNENADAIKNLFTADAVRTEADGKIINGKDSIAKLYADAFAGSDAKLTITQQMAEAQADGSIHSTGTWQVSGKTSAGEAIERKGTYDVTDVKEDGNWKIKKQVLTEQ